MTDSYNRTIDYLRLSVTDRCNLRCIYCMPEEGVQSLAHEDILRIEEIEEAVRVAAGMHPQHPPDGRRASRAPRRGGSRARYRAYARHRERVDDHERRAVAEDGGRPQGSGLVAREHLARHARSRAVQADHAPRRAAADARPTSSL